MSQSHVRDHTSHVIISWATSTHFMTLDQGILGSSYVLHLLIGANHTLCELHSISDSGDLGKSLSGGLINFENCNLSLVSSGLLWERLSSHLPFNSIVFLNANFTLNTSAIFHSLTFLQFNLGRI